MGSDAQSCKEGGRYWTEDEDCKAGMVQADAAQKMPNAQRLSELHQHLPSTEDEESDMDVDG